MVDAVRSVAPGFIFTTSLPPAITAAALRECAISAPARLSCARSIRSVCRLLMRLLRAGRPAGHAEPVTYRAGACRLPLPRPRRCPICCMAEHGIYIQPINYPTVPKGTERLRLTPSPKHDDALMDHLVGSLRAVYRTLALPLGT